MMAARARLVLLAFAAAPACAAAHAPAAARSPVPVQSPAAAQSPAAGEQVPVVPRRPDSRSRATLMAAPAFSFVSARGERVRLEDLRGKEVLIDFWASWCGPCRQSQPSLDEIRRKLADQPFVLIEVSADRDEKQWRSFLAGHKPEGHHYLDRDGAIRRLYGVSAFPTFVLVDHDGAIRGRRVGWGLGHAGWIEQEVRKAIEARGRP